MTRHTPPGLARMLLRIRPLGEHRAEIETDLLELFSTRCERRGIRYARRRYYGDVLSLWRHPGSRPAPTRAPASGGGLSALGQDLTYALRLLRRNPGVVTVTVAGLGLAIGVSTSVFSLLNAVAFRSTGIEDPSTAVRVMRGYKNGISTSWPYSHYMQLRDGATRVTLDAYLGDAAFITERPTVEATESTHGLFVTGGYLATLSKHAAVGRLLAPADDVVGAPPAVVVSHRFWTRRLAADPAVIGRTLWLNGVAFTVVGVSERRFTGTVDSSPAFWAPLATYHVVHGGPPFDRTTAAGVDVVGRIQRGLAQREAEAELGAVAVGIGATLTDSEGDKLTGVRFDRAGEHMSTSENRTMALVTAIVLAVIGLVVGIYGVTAFVVGQRTQEISVRLALGATGRDIGRLLLSDSLRPVVIGLVIGVVPAVLGSQLFAGALYGIRSTDPVAFGAAILVLLAAAVVAVILPTRHATSLDPASVLRQL